MFGKMKFKVLIAHTDEIAIHTATLLGKEGFDVYDLEESNIVNDEDEIVVRAFMICCRGKRRNYEQLKIKHNLTEKIYDGVKTLF
jgi:hypothetical protein